MPRLEISDTGSEKDAELPRGLGVSKVVWIKFNR